MTHKVWHFFPFPVLHSLFLSPPLCFLCQHWAYLLCLRHCFSSCRCRRQGSPLCACGWLVFLTTVTVLVCALSLYQARWNTLDTESLLTNEVCCQLIVEEESCFYESSHTFAILSSTGRNALHLAAKYGHALCLQKLLQVVETIVTLASLFDWK
jgi:hypothetical protein